jgi:Flp pilus assembly protein TadG
MQSAFTGSPALRAAISHLRPLPRAVTRRHHGGSAIVKFTVVGPLITLLGLAMLQYGLLCFTKNQVNHASFMVARASNTGHANIATIEDAYAGALVPLCGEGTDTAKLEASCQRARADVQAQARIALLHPTAESYVEDTLIP